MIAHLELEWSERDFKDLYYLTDVLVSNALPCHIMVLMGQQRNIKAACIHVLSLMQRLVHQQALWT